MGNIRQSEHYAATEEMPDIEEFREYRGEVELANSTLAFAIGGDIVSAEEWSQGPHGVEAAWEDSGHDWEIIPEEEQIIVPTRDKVVPRTIDDLEDPYNSPLLDGFLEMPFTPPEVVGFISKDGKKFKSQPGKKTPVGA